MNSVNYPYFAARINVWWLWPYLRMRHIISELAAEDYLWFQTMCFDLFQNMADNAEVFSKDQKVSASNPINAEQDLNQLHLNMMDGWMYTICTLTSYIAFLVSQDQSGRFLTFKTEKLVKNCSGILVVCYFGFNGWLFGAKFVTAAREAAFCVVQ